jgi:NAD(P)-dependent dehydrogenase (short-subunit alcohol dehydrogenase family)
MSPSESKPKLAVIMGVGIGLGGVLSKRFAKAGHPVAMMARTTEFTNKLEDEITAAGGTAKGYVVDAQDPDAVEAMFSDAEAAYGPLGVSIFSIGGRELKDFLDLDVQMMEETWRKHFLTAFNMGQAAGKRMVPQGEGTIIYAAATSSRIGQPTHAHFAAAKFGVRGMAESMWRSFAPKGVHVAHVTLNGGVGNARRIKRDPHLVEQDALMPMDELAETFYRIHCQPKSCWSFNMELQPWNQPL